MEEWFGMYIYQCYVWLVTPDDDYFHALEILKQRTKYKMFMQNEPGITFLLTNKFKYIMHIFYLNFTNNLELPLKQLLQMCKACKE